MLRQNIAEPHQNNRKLTAMKSDGLLDSRMNVRIKHQDLIVMINTSFHHS